MDRIHQLLSHVNCLHTPLSWTQVDVMAAGHLRPLVLFFFWGYLRSEDHSKIRQTGSGDCLSSFFDVAQDLHRSLDGILALLLFPTPDMSWERDEPLKNRCILLQGITLLQQARSSIIFQCPAHGENHQEWLPLEEFWYQALSLPVFCQAQRLITW